MNWLDAVIVIVLIISAIGGLASGLIKTVFSLAGIIVGVVLAGRLHNGLADHLSFISNENAAHIVAFIIIFLIVIIIATILGAIISKIVSAMFLGCINRLAGAAFGAIAGCFFMAAILAIWVKYAGENSAVAGSAIAPFLLERFPQVLALLPSEFDVVRRFFQ
jgi:membrane protein required for colicin V production